jgi:hypothetical protein
MLVDRVVMAGLAAAPEIIAADSAAASELRRIFLDSPTQRDQRSCVLDMSFAAYGRVTVS